MMKAEAQGIVDTLPKGFLIRLAMMMNHKHNGNITLHLKDGIIKTWEVREVGEQ